MWKHVFILSFALSALAQAETPVELQSCSGETELRYPKAQVRTKRAELEKTLQERLALLGFEYFSRRAIATGMTDLSLMSTEEFEANFTNTPKTEELKAKTEALKANCEKRVREFSLTHKNDFFRATCGEVTITAGNPTRLDATPRFLLTNKGSDPYAKERRCKSLRACATKSMKLPFAVEDEWAIRNGAICQAYENGGLEGLATKLRARGIKFSGDGRQLATEVKKETGNNSAE